MKSIAFTLLILLQYTCYAQLTDCNKQMFVTKTYDLKNKKDKKEYKIWLKNNQLDKEKRSKKTKLGKVVYEDNNFEIYSYCFGEFGGYILFKDKSSDYCYYYPCKCLSQVEYHNNKYLIVASLSHLSGSTKISIVNDPRNLNKTHKDSIDFLKYNSVSKKSLILDSCGLESNILIPYLDQLYLIFSKDGNTFLGEIKENNKLIVLDTLFHRALRAGNVKKTNNIRFEKFYYYSRYIFFGGVDILKKDELSGCLFVKNDTIVIAYKGINKLK